MTDRGLDFEKAEKDTACGSKLMVEMAVSGVRHHLNAQLAQRIAAARQEEREKAERHFVEWLRSTNAHRTAEKFLARNSGHPDLEAP